MDRFYTTPVGATVQLTGDVFRSYLSCKGCNKGWPVRHADAERKANEHAATCRRTPNRQHTPPGGVARTRR